MPPILLSPRLYSADIFVPGRASYPEVDPENGGHRLVLTEASIVRGMVAARYFNPDIDHKVVFAGSNPGLAQATHWPKLPDGSPYVPTDGQHEADQMAQPLIERLRQEPEWRRWNDANIAARVRRQVASSNSLGDVLWSIRQGHLNPADYKTNPGRVVEVAAGRRHFRRFKEALALGLDIDPRRVRRIPMREDPYGTPPTEILPGESRWAAILKEHAALVFQRAAMRNVKPGDIDSLAEAEARFVQMAQNPAHALLRHPVAIVRSIAGVIYPRRR